MEILRTVLVIAHFIGMGMIVGCYFANIKSARVIPGMLHASYLQLITGLALTGLAEARLADDPDMAVNHMKIGIKVALAILVTVFAFVGNRQQKAVAGVGPAAAATGSHPSALMAHLTFAAALLAVIVAVAVPGAVAS